MATLVELERARGAGLTTGDDGIDAFYLGAEQVLRLVEQHLPEGVTDIIDEGAHLDAWVECSCGWQANGALDYSDHLRAIWRGVG